MKSICFTGHRQIKITPEYRKYLSEVIEKLIKNGAENFYAGGAIGFDTLCEEIVLELKKIYPQIKLHLLLPCPPNEQTAKWTAVEKSNYNRILSAADNVIICSEHYYDGCMKKRNQQLVNAADVCVCYCTNSRSGSAQTVRMAEIKNIKIINTCQSPDIML